MALTDEENKVLQLKYQSKKIGAMNEDELSKWIRAILIKIHVITGWTIPSDNNLLNILLDQFRKTLVEKYSEINPDEIEYAFRSNTTVEDYGKALNLNLIDKVLTNYLDARYKISMTEEMIKNRKEPEAFNLKSDVNWREQIEQNYQYFLLQDKFFSIHPYEYDQLVEDKFIVPDSKEHSLEEKERFVKSLFEISKKKNFNNLYTK